MNETKINQQESIKSNIDLYGLLISDSINIECKPLISCLDDILRLFNDYFKYINKVFR